MSEKFKPNDVLETDGDAMGRIKDKSLAEIGANEEELARQGKTKYTEIMEDKELSDEEKLDAVGEQAMGNEVYARATTRAKKLGITDKDYVQTEASIAQDRFHTEHAKLREKRNKEGKLLFETEDEL